jgi:hypothetical protein
MLRGVLGLNAPMFKGYLRFIANSRARDRAPHGWPAEPG